MCEHGPRANSLERGGEECAERAKRIVGSHGPFETEFRTGHGCKAVVRGSPAPRGTGPLVAFLSDFGTRDWYVAAVKAVILSRAPHARVVDITHEIPPQDIVAGAFTLAAAIDWFPSGTIALAVVDPGVGSRRALLAAIADGRYLIGPDNGLLSLCLARAKHRTVVRLTRTRYWLSTVSRTFHGRDILAPVAAHLLQGVALNRLGPRITRVTPLDLPRPTRRRGTLWGHIVHIDTFGNLITNLPGAWLSAMGPANRLAVHCGHLTAPVVSSYAHAPLDTLLAVVGSSGWLEIAVRNGSAARTLPMTRGAPVVVDRGRR